MQTKKFMIQCGITMIFLFLVIFMVNTFHDYKQFSVDEEFGYADELNPEKLVFQQTINKDRADKLARESLERLEIKKIATNFVDESLDNIKSIINCKDRDFSPKILQHGKYWIFKNFIRADHGPLKCHETITYTTHSDLTFLDNLIQLLERWEAPLSIALYAPGTDFEATIASILYLRNCHPQGNLVAQYATFHLFFDDMYLPKKIPKASEVLEEQYVCPETPPYIVVANNFKSTFRRRNKLLYPVNVARNLARGAALTHFVLASDIELYPSPNFVEDFFNLIHKNTLLVTKGNNVFVLPIFEVVDIYPVPINKTELQAMFKQKQVIWFHFEICHTCHTIPHADDWMNQQENVDMKITASAKRSGSYEHWEPIYVGTNSEPLYDERLTWEGKSDKMTQGYILCLLDYNFHILSNAFLVHKPGIKKKSEAARPENEKKTRKIIDTYILPEIHLFYGQKKECKIN